MSEFAKPIFFLTRYEVSAILAKRAQEISLGSPSVLTEVEISRLNFSPLAIAEEELRQRKLNYIIMREMPGGRSIPFYVSDAKGVGY